MTQESRLQGAERLLALRDGLAAQAEALAVQAEKIGYRPDAERMRLLIPRLEQGLVRVAVIGATSSGKSTLINALLEHIVVPENPNVSSPIPVWIGYAAGEPSFTVYEESGEEGSVRKTQYPVQTFLKEYCYSLYDVFNRDTDRFSRVRYGAVSLPSPCLAGGAVLIDTLGISASDLDTGKTNAVLEEGVDLVLFVSSNSSGNNEYTHAEIDFLRTNIMGLHPEKRRVTHPVRPENILFVHNLYDKEVSPVHQAMDANLDKVLEGFPPEVIAGVKAHNIFYVQALMGRYLSCGAYPYTRNAPAGCRAEELEGLEDWEWREKEAMSVLSREEMERQSRMGQLRENLMIHARRLCRGQSSAVVHRIGELRDLANAVQLTASGRLSQTVTSLAEQENLRAECEDLAGKIEKQKRSIQEAMEYYESQFISGLGRSYQASLDKIRNQVEGLVDTEMADPPKGFEARWSEYRQWDEAQKRQYIQPFLPPLMGEILKACTDQIVEMLSYDAGHDDDPLAVLEKSRQYILKEGDNAKLLMGALKQQPPGGLEHLSSASQALCGALSSRLEVRLKTAVTNSLATTGKNFEERLAPHIAKLDWKGLFAILPHGPKGLWRRVRDRVLKPLTQAALEDLGRMTQPGENGTASVLTTAVMKAYRDVTTGLQDILTELLAVVRLQVQQIDRQIEAGQALSEEEKARYQSMARSCEAIQKQLNVWMDELLV